MLYYKVFYRIGEIWHCCIIPLDKVHELASLDQVEEFQVCEVVSDDDK